jgi:hypothetical protein
VSGVADDAAEQYAAVHTTAPTPALERLIEDTKPA